MDPLVRLLKEITDAGSLAAVRSGNTAATMKVLGSQYNRVSAVMKKMATEQDEMLERDIAAAKRAVRRVNGTSFFPFFAHAHEFKDIVELDHSKNHLAERNITCMQRVGELTRSFSQAEVRALFKSGAASKNAGAKAGTAHGAATMMRLQQEMRYTAEFLALLPRVMQMMVVALQVRLQIDDVQKGGGLDAALEML